MLARDALDYLITELGLSAIGLTPDGETDYHFTTPFGFTLTETDAATLSIFAPLDIPVAVPRPLILRRLLEANLQGVETGQGMMCLKDDGTLGYRDVLDLREMTLEQFQLRFVDFSLYFDFWRSEGLKLLQDELGPDYPHSEGFLRL